jgi:hypothetical protein
MAANIYKMVPRRISRREQRARDTRQYIIELHREGLLSEGPVADIENAIHLDQRRSDRPRPDWVHSMISEKQAREVLRRIKTSTDRPAATGFVFLAVLTRLNWDTGEVLADRRQLAEDALVTEREAARALSVLVRIRALIRRRRGNRTVFEINPEVGWKGDLDLREERAKRLGSPRLVVSNDERVAEEA